MQRGSRGAVCAAIMRAMSASRQKEAAMKASMAEAGVHTAVADDGGEFMPSVMRSVERAAACAKREGLIGDTHHEEGAVRPAHLSEVCIGMGHRAIQATPMKRRRY